MNLPWPARSVIAGLAGTTAMSVAYGTERGSGTRPANSTTTTAGARGDRRRRPASAERHRSGDEELGRHCVGAMARRSGGTARCAT